MVKNRSKKRGWLFSSKTICYSTKSIHTHTHLIVPDRHGYYEDALLELLQIIHLHRLSFYECFSACVASVGLFVSLDVCAGLFVAQALVQQNRFVMTVLRGEHQIRPTCSKRGALTYQFLDHDGLASKNAVIDSTHRIC